MPLKSVFRCACLVQMCPRQTFDKQIAAKTLPVLEVLSQFNSLYESTFNCITKRRSQGKTWYALLKRFDAISGLTDVFKALINIKWDLNFRPKTSQVSLKKNDVSILSFLRFISFMESIQIVTWIHRVAPSFCSNRGLLPMIESVAGPSGFFSAT